MGCYLCTAGRPWKKSLALGFCLIFPLLKLPSRSWTRLPHFNSLPWGKLLKISAGETSNQRSLLCLHGWGQHPGWGWDNCNFPAGIINLRFNLDKYKYKSVMGKQRPKCFLLEGRSSTKSSSAQILCKGDGDGILSTSWNEEWLTGCELCAAGENIEKQDWRKCYGQSFKKSCRWGVSQEILQVSLTLHHLASTIGRRCRQVERTPWMSLLPLLGNHIHKNSFRGHIHKENSFRGPYS